MLGFFSQANNVGAATTAASLSGVQLLDRAIADLEVSLSLRPDESLPPLDKCRENGTERVSGKKSGAGKRQSEKKKAGGSAPSKPAKGVIAPRDFAG